ncbi:hypothetical protein KBK19_15600 [Microvirga sp. STR05]|uniref:GCN5 family acetyltransferase n=1 Tax=Hymenobacter duratus TaxID=2771356 RepID=A0ABR8JHY5_9BACT|nr:GCN5 family acetyltransferase [Hymenobacter duratus]MBD2716466.1 GCN5 family acetyltransferase [Hymenobacter duratus]MBR7951381.1 hypothetical protein [Microvirga sp. STR05]
MTKFPDAIDSSKIGTYPAGVWSGGGHFYDEVLEYRVWVYSDDDGEYFCPFENYKSALRFSKKTIGAKDPDVLILQREYVDEPQEGVFVKITSERVAEWRPEWLQNSKREKGSIDRFIAEQNRKNG